MTRPKPKLLGIDPGRPAKPLHKADPSAVFLAFVAGALALALVAYIIFGA